MKLFAAIVVACLCAPALAQVPPARQDDETLRGMAKVKTAAAWVPWSSTSEKRPCRATSREL